MAGDPVPLAPARPEPPPRSGLALARAKRYLRRAAVGTLARTAMAASRPQPIALVYGAPDYEENSLVTALRLTERYPGRTVLVCVDPGRTRHYLEVAAGVVGGNPAAVELRTLRKIALLPTYGRAELIFYTHGLFFSPGSRGRRLQINLWHGTGPKSSVNRNFRSVFRADAVSSASPSWGGESARTLGTRPGPVLPGNARADLVVGSAEARQRLGWGAHERVVLWLPTFRTSRDVSVGTLTEGRSVLDQGSQTLYPAAERAGVRLIAKLHPFDAEEFGGHGELLGTQDLWDRGVSLGQALACADAVISDYSSTWVDAMAGGTAVGLFCPDLDLYEQERGLHPPPLREAAAGLFLDSPETIGEFFSGVADGRGFRPGDQAACFERIGLVSGPRCDAMLTAVGALGVRLRGYDFGLGLKPGVTGP